MAALEWILGNIPSVIAVCIAFGFIITIHELGHFIMARRVGIRCPKFAIGFGPRIFSFDYRGTEFSICCLPLGGYVMMLGEDPDSDEQQTEFKMVSDYLPENVLPNTPAEIVKAMEKLREEKPPEFTPACAEINKDQDKEKCEDGEKDSVEEKTPAVDPNWKPTPSQIKEEESQYKSVLGHIRYLPERIYETCADLEGNFNNKTIPQRMAVVVGGVTMNFISALILFWIIGSIYGLVDLTPNSLPVVMKVFDNSPAAAAGLKYGDHIDEVAHQPIVSGQEMVKVIGAHPGEKVDMIVDRSGEKLNLTIVPNILIGPLTFHPNFTDNGLPKIVALNAFGEDIPTEGLAVGDVVSSVNGKEVSSISQLVEAFRLESQVKRPAGTESVKVSLGLKGKDKPVDIAMTPYELEPAGKIGIMPAQVTEFKFIDKTTSTIEAVSPGSIADKAGFKPNDIIYLLNGARVCDITSLNELLAKTSQGTQSLVFDLARDGEHVQIEVSQKTLDTTSMGLTLQPITFGLVVKHSFSLIGRLIIAPVIIIQQLANKMLSPELVKASMSGPLGIMQMIFELSDQGVGKFLYIVALINAAVGAFNVIPFPALDGARLLVLFIGGVRGKELDYRKEAMVHQVGLFLLLGLVLLVTILDVQRLFAGVPLTK